MPLDADAAAWPIDWPPPPGVRTFMSTRRGGVSEGRFDSLNLGLHVGDDPARVARNRQLLAEFVGAEPQWLNQVHGAQVVDAASVAAARASGGNCTADAQWATQADLACAVLVADCMPVLFSTQDGRAVAAAHAGWRGLAAGVLEQSVAALSREARCEAADIQAWLGPCIGPRQFEVGDDVRDRFGPRGAHRFQPHRRPDGTAAWLCDLVGLARDRLQDAGLDAIYGGRACTVELASDFFSFRRDGTTGRMAAVIVKLP